MRLGGIFVGGVPAQAMKSFFLLTSLVATAVGIYAFSEPAISTINSPSVPGIGTTTTTIGGDPVINATENSVGATNAAADTQADVVKKLEAELRGVKRQ